MYFLMMPLSLSGGSQDTNTTELLEAAAFTPAGGPGTKDKKKNTAGFGGDSEKYKIYYRTCGIFQAMVKKTNFK